VTDRARNLRQSQSRFRFSMRHFVYEVASSWVLLAGLFVAGFLGRTVLLPWIEDMFDLHDPAMLIGMVVSGIIVVLGIFASHALRPVAVRFDLAPKIHSQAFSSYSGMAGGLLGGGITLAIAGQSAGASWWVIIGSIAAIIGFTMLAHYCVRRHQFVEATSQQSDLAANSV
jgi:hypothetical protein